MVRYVIIGRISLTLRTQILPFPSSLRARSIGPLNEASLRRITGEKENDAVACAGELIKV
eukprot:760593-Hanusia_phi.AAC.14